MFQSKNRTQRNYQKSTSRVRLFISIVFLNLVRKTHNTWKMWKDLPITAALFYLFIRWLQDNGIRKLPKHVFKDLTNLEEL